MEGGTTDKRATDVSARALVDKTQESTQPKRSI